MNDKKVSLVLSGGGARGMAHLGVIRELWQRGYSIHAVAGCSIGAIVGAMLAMGKLEEFIAFMETDDGDAIFKQLDFTFSTNGFIKGQKLIERFQCFAPDCNMEDLPVKLVIVASDLRTGEQVVFRSGSVYRAMRASVAIPAVITAVEDSGHWLVDGGIINPLPLDCVARIAGDLLIAVNLYAAPLIPEAGKSISIVSGGVHDDPTFREQIKEGWQNMTGWKENLMESLFESNNGKYDFFSTLRIMSEISSKRLAEQSLLLYPVDILVEIPIASCGIFSFGKIKELIRLGEQKAESALVRWQLNKQKDKQRSLLLNQIAKFWPFFKKK